MVQTYKARAQNQKYQYLTIIPRAYEAYEARKTTGQKIHDPEMERKKQKLDSLRALYSKHFIPVKTNFQFFIYSGICDLAEKYGALTFIDECHATGFLGETGRYSVEILLIKDNCLL